MKCAGIGWYRGFGSIRQTCECQLSTEKNHDDQQQTISREDHDGQRPTKKLATRKPKQTIRQPEGNESQHEQSVG